MNPFDLVTLLACAVGAWLFQHRLRALRGRTAASDGATGRVSLIVPARNEAHNLPILLASLARLDPPAHEIIVVDDHSEDDTGEIARSFGARVVVPGPMADRFIGKTWACQCGADVASGDYLLFTDADTLHAPGSLGDSMAALRTSGAGLLSLAPTHRCLELWERLQGSFQLLLLIAARAGARTDQHYANGQYLLFRRDVYDALSGHHAVSAFIAEDLAFVRAARTAGHRVHLLFAPGALLVRMYPEGFFAFFAGWRRNFREGLRSGGTRTALEMVPVIAWLVGAPLCTLRAMLDGQHAPALVWLAIFVASSWLVAREQRHHGDFHGGSALLYPLFTLVFVGVSLASLVDSVRRAPIKWRGRSISAVR